MRAKSLRIVSINDTKKRTKHRVHEEVTLEVKHANGIYKKKTQTYMILKTKRMFGMNLYFRTTRFRG